MDVVAVVEEEGEGEGEDEILDKSSRTGCKSQCTDAQPSPTLVRPRPSAATSAPAPLAGSHSRSTQGPIQPGPSRSLVLVLSEGTTTNTRPKVHLSYSGTSLLRLLGLPVVHILRASITMTTSGAVPGDPVYCHQVLTGTRLHDVQSSESKPLMKPGGLKNK